MKEYIKQDPWKIIEESYTAEFNQISESLMSIGNGKMGQRANFEETYTGSETLQGSYIAGVYYPDKTRVGWWKNGYPEYFAKVLNSCNWIGIEVLIDGKPLDVATAQSVHSFERSLDMRQGTLNRTMDITTSNGARVIVESQRLVSMADDEIGAIKYSVKSVDFTGAIVIKPYLDFDVVNEDSNYDENFWIASQAECEGHLYVEAITKKTGYCVGVAMSNQVTIDGDELRSTKKEADEKYVSETFETKISPGSTITLEKCVGVTSSMNYPTDKIKAAACQSSLEAGSIGYHTIAQDHSDAWKDIWDMCDIQIDGDVSAQQAIRFNIFQLYQTYTGQDDRLNIGPKGFTGEKYGGSTYWDTEAYCLPFYLSTADQNVARNLLIYRYKHLGKAIENAEKLGFDNGAALYPMVTMTGEECHNEWEITFEEIHRNGAIAYAIFDYIRYTEDHDYLAQYGVEVLVAIARFWAQRVNWSERKGQYVMLGVTGPNEYENNVNNNWYTNYIASWSMSYAAESLQYVKSTNQARHTELVDKMNFNADELKKWQHIVDHMYYPADDELGIFLQQDNFLDKEQVLVNDLADEHRPINQNWSWDRILRSCFIKQADVLQGMYFFEEQFDEGAHRRNFEFYEPRTVHESSLSPCVHGILASKLGMHEKAYEMYLRTARLDLDDYNNDTEDGCHITSMAGTWLAIVKGFGGQRITDGKLSFTPSLPKQWNKLSFKMKYRQNLLEVVMHKDGIEIINHNGPDCDIIINGNEVKIPQTQLVEA